MCVLLRVKTQGLLLLGFFVVVVIVFQDSIETDILEGAFRVRHCDES